MIDLLPQNDRKILHSEYRARRGVVWALMALALLATSVVLMATVSSVLAIDQYVLKSTLAQFAGLGSNVAEFDAYQESVTEANKLLALLGGEKGSALLASDIVTGALSVGRDGVKINSLNMTRMADGSAAAELRGVSRSRKALLAYVANLKAVENFSEVDSPISNLIKDANSDFIITFKARLKK